MVTIATKLMSTSALGMLRKAGLRAVPDHVGSGHVSKFLFCRALLRRTGLHFGGARSKVRRLRRNEGGAAALELALIAMPFFMLLGAVFEAGLVTLAQQSLDSGLDRASRQIFTGSFQGNYDGTPSADRFRSAMCPAMVYIDCSKVLVEVTTAGTFGSSSPTNPYNSTTRGVTTNFGTKFSCPNGNDIVTVRAAAVIPRFFGFLTLNGLQMASGGQMVTSTAVFRAEPYPSGRC